MVLRTAVPEDFERVSTLLTASYPVLLAGHYSPDVLEAALPRMTTAQPALLASGTFYVVDRGDGLAGCGGWTKAAPGSEIVEHGVAHLRHFATHPDCLRRGIGRSILARCAREAMEQGVVTFRVFSSLPAEQFYAQAGLISEGQVDVTMGPGIVIPAVSMQGRLADMRM